MSPIEALTTFIGRFDAFEAAVLAHQERTDTDIDKLQLDFAAIVKEMELTRKSLDRFTAAFGTGSVSIVAAAVAVILFGPGG